LRERHDRVWIATQAEGTDVKTFARRLRNCERMLKKHARPAGVWLGGGSLDGGGERFKQQRIALLERLREVERDVAQVLVDQPDGHALFRNAPPKGLIPE